MAKAYASTVVNADVDTVWGIVRDFGAVGRWIPGCRGCELVWPGDRGQPIRRLILSDSVVEEVLVALDDVDRRIRYGFVHELQQGMRNFVGTAHVREVSDGNRAFLEWLSEFDTEQKWETTMVGTISTMLANIVAAVAAEAEVGGNV